MGPFRLKKDYTRNLIQHFTLLEIKMEIKKFLNSIFVLGIENCYFRHRIEKSKSEAESLMKKQIETKNELEKMQLDYDNLKAELTCKSIKIQYLEKSK